MFSVVKTSVEQAIQVTFFQFYLQFILLTNFILFKGVGPKIMERDLNAAENILFLLTQQLLGKQRPILFRRGLNLPDTRR